MASDSGVDERSSAEGSPVGSANLLLQRLKTSRKSAASGAAEAERTMARLFSHSTMSPLPRGFAAARTHCRPSKAVQAPPISDRLFILDYGKFQDDECAG